LNNNSTEIIFGKDEDNTLFEEQSPRLFVCEGRDISEYRLSGVQLLGRPTEQSKPDIPIDNRFVSRQHGIFNTNGQDTTFTASLSTNGISYKGHALGAGEIILLKDGDEFIIPAGDNKDPEGSFVLLVFASSSSRIRLWRDLQKASSDKLTGLGSRETFITWWQKNHWKSDYARSVIFILDVDDFKHINDACGHNKGDEVLKQVTAELLRDVRYENQICRWGGDEFIGILPGDPVTARHRLQQILTNINNIVIDGCPRLTASIGFADISMAKDPLDMNELVEMADWGLYQVKKNGKNGICEYVPKRENNAE
jgi:diguanylate cyclase (GGDEF)-like protein